MIRIYKELYMSENSKYRCVTLAELAEEIGLSTSYFYEQIQLGNLPKQDIILSRKMKRYSPELAQHLRLNWYKMLDVNGEQP